MSGFFLLGRFPSRGRQFGDPGDGPIAQLGQDVMEVLAQINVQATAGLHDRGDGGDFRSGLLTANVQPVFTSQHQRAKRAFAPVMPRPGLCRVAKNNHPLLRWFPAF